MKSLRLHFELLFKNINPPDERKALIKEIVGALRVWLADHDFQTVSPHTRLIGSYARSTAVLWVKDIDILIFLASDALDRTPNALLLELRRILDDYPDAVVNASGQRRSIRLELVEHDLVVDIVPAVAPDGDDQPLKVPDRPRQDWISSDPFGYMGRLSRLNKEHDCKVVPLVKLTKVWRDVNMKIRRPKSYMLEVMVLDAVESGGITLVGELWPSILAQLFAHWADRYHALMEQGHGVPRVFDPQLGHLISAGWQRTEFETFMRRVREADAAARRALVAGSEEIAAEEWSRLFGDCWPSQEDVDAAAAEEASTVAPGRSSISSAGLVIAPTAARTVPSQSTQFHGGQNIRPSRLWPRPKDRPSQQIAAMRQTFPQFDLHATRRGGIAWRGFLQPTAESPRYPIVIVHEPPRPPRVFVPGRDLDPDCRHLYPDRSLCLYWPEQWRWKSSHSLAATIVPWAAFWLYYYELWETTGRWLGPSSPHGLRPEETS